MGNIFVRRAQGIIGAGKSTFLRCLESQLGKRVLVVQEPVDLWRSLPCAVNPSGPPHNLLETYYSSPDKFAMQFQTFSLSTRMAALHEALVSVDRMRPADRPAIILVERSSGGDACFARMLYHDGLIDAAWFSAYDFMRLGYERVVGPVDGMIYIEVDTDTAMARLQARARGEEVVAVSTEYQRRLAEEIARWLESERRPVLRLDATLWDSELQTGGPALTDTVTSFATRVAALRRCA